MSPSPPIWKSEIQVAPQTLVISSGGDNVTIHTDLKGSYETLPDLDVLLEIVREDGKKFTADSVSVFLDDCGYVVVRCSRKAAAETLGDFTGKQTTATVTLEVEGPYSGNYKGSQVIGLRK